MLKASMGGGGKGLRLIHSAEEVEEAYTTAKSESLSSFGDEDVYKRQGISRIDSNDLKISIKKGEEWMHDFPLFLGFTMTLPMHSFR